ncbi:hypothetical protein EDD69_101255 [Thermolongibacillus altinsuensis]|jgi:hypothetical protein|uniref:Uncharacterized protein n=1 Tax=Thermolongibacillus altinsuensis TaxID=575256 RepID=A0A4R1QJG6_9BACL|nr:DNA modification system-associated small protein [Thermolongibacillus altinsuensis]TCL53247.1 hypothetical protein EDD69_101255 [Thermolongibacillus altinsuensis]GMB07942.1 hypothetical protein B1no1_06520 [Thermolongibacillus altinsuensis]
MHKEEEKIIEELCEKYQLKPFYFKELFKIEKEYADRNMERRTGIYRDIKNKINEWVEGGK